MTIATDRRRPWFKQANVVHACTRALRNACRDERFDLLAYCFMPDHVHVLVGTDEGSDLVRLVHRFKQRTGWWFRNRAPAGGLKASPTGAPPSLWQKSYYDHILRRDEELDDVVRYILGNPIRAGLAATVDEYPYSWSAFGIPER